MCAVWAIEELQGMLSTYPKVSEFIGALSLHSRLRPFLEGQLDTRSMFFFASLTLLTLYFAVRSVESRKWR